MIRGDRPAEDKREMEMPRPLMERALAMLAFHIAEDRLTNVDQEALVLDLYRAMVSERFL
jgi:hypothetical protein